MTKKTIAWYGLATGVGSGLIFVILIYLQGPKSISGNLVLYLWPVVSVLAILVSLIGVFFWYRRKTGFIPGPWRISMRDLFLVNLFIAVLFLLYQAYFKENFLRIGLPMIMFTAVGLMFGLLFASREKIHDGKWMFSVGFTCCYLGTIGAGTICVVSGFLLIRCYQFNLKFLDLFIQYWENQERMFGYWMRHMVPVIVFCIPTGLVLNYAANKRRIPEPSDDNKTKKGKMKVAVSSDKSIETKQ